MAKLKWRLRTGASSDAVSSGCDLDNPTDLEAMWAHLNLIVHSLEFE